MTTAERAQAIVDAAARLPFPIFADLTTDKLLQLVESELGHPAILDDFQAFGDSRTKAVAPSAILHILSGNTPHAGLQSLVRGLLLGAPRNLVKLPSAGLPEIKNFRDALPTPLAESIHIKDQLPDEWIRDATAVIAFGSDETIHQLRARFRPDQTFIAHGHKISFGIFFESPHPEVAALAARDVSLFDQQGCLSPHLFYVANDPPDTAKKFAQSLAAEMNFFERQTPRRTLSPHEENDILQLLSSYQFRAANDNRVRIWSSENSTAWTVVYEDEPQFAVSPLNRFVFVKPLPPDLTPHLSLVRPHLSSISVWPFSDTHTRRAATLGASRICKVGDAQKTSLFWRQDGMQSLAPLVSRIDIAG